MALIQTLSLAHLPPSLAVHVALYQEVTNASFLQQQLLLGNSDFEYAFIDASVILSPNHLLAAVFRAVNDSDNGRLKSRNVHSEIVFALSPNNNIATSFRTFGILPTTRSLLVVKISTNPSITASSISQHLSATIEGTAIEFSKDNISKFTDIKKVKKIYKIGNKTDVQERKNRGSEKGTVVGELDDKKEMEVVILGMMALRGQT
ncbi:MAG: hypothetical protein HETSPECPRED_003809 [Heterodermia speciosa]|uniref:EKC/KEOPS complex subunit CGI121 n=1 Tax=Heterodermia speciosa TaxID=116794 RepID=A0A8H3F3F3_9LECA|nr:MAG: hypothetical protein HETSPECPRED_003809 [Heterodermia speciosa]